MTEVRNVNNPRPFSVLEQLARIEKARSRQQAAEAFVHGILLVAFGFALGCLAFSLAGACTL